MRFSTTKLIPVVLACVPLSLPLAAHGQSANSLDSLYACEALTDDADQLACFRAETAKLRAGITPLAVTPPPAPTITAPTPPEPEFAPLKKPKEAKAPKSRTMAIRSTSTTASGHIRFTLENGEIWQQLEKEYVRLGRGDPDMLTIKRKSMGSFLATVNDKRPSFRVRRVE